MKENGCKGFTLIEIVVTIAIILILASVGVLSYTDLVNNTEESLCKSQRKDAIMLYQIYMIDNEYFEIDNYSGMSFLVGDILAEEYKCPSGGEYTWQVDDNGNITISCSEHSVVSLELTPLGNDFTEITSGMVDLINDFYIENGRYPRTWGEYVYSDIGLDSEDWEEPVLHLYYSPGGNRINVSPEEGYQIKITNDNGEELVMKERYNWNIVYDMRTEQWYYKSVSPENLVNIDTLLIEKDN